MHRTLVHTPYSRRIDESSCIDGSYWRKGSITAYSAIYRAYSDILLVNVEMWMAPCACYPGIVCLHHSRDGCHRVIVSPVM